MNTIIQLLFHLLSKLKTSKHLMAIVASIVFVVLLCYGTHQIKKKAYNEGVVATKQEYEQRIKEATEKQRALEAQQQAQIDNYQKQLQAVTLKQSIDFEEGKRHAEVNTNHLLNDIDLGTKRLYIDTYNSTPTTMQTDKAQSTSTTGDTTRTTSRTALSERAARFLVVKGKEADNTLRELNLCKQTLNTYLKAVEQYNQTLENTK